MCISSGAVRLPAVLLSILLVGCGGGGDKPKPMPNQAPLSNAGADQSVNKAAIVTLDGSASPSTHARKNLLVSTGNSNYSYYAATPGEIWAIDPRTGAGVWRSPSLPGEFSRDSLHDIDVDLDGQYELAFGTNIGAFVTR